MWAQVKWCSRGVGWWWVFGFDIGFWILDFDFDFGFCYRFCSAKVGGVIEKLDGGGGGGWLTEEEK